MTSSHDDPTRLILRYPATDDAGRVLIAFLAWIADDLTGHGEEQLAAWRRVMERAK